MNSGNLGPKSSTFAAAGQTVARRNDRATSCVLNVSFVEQIILFGWFLDFLHVSF